MTCVTEVPQLSGPDSYSRPFPLYDEYNDYALHDIAVQGMGLPVELVHIPPDRVQELAVQRAADPYFQYELRRFGVEDWYHTVAAPELKPFLYPASSADVSPASFFTLPRSEEHPIDLLRSVHIGDTGYLADIFESRDYDPGMRQCLTFCDQLATPQVAAACFMAAHERQLERWETGANYPTTIDDFPSEATLRLYERLQKDGVEAISVNGLKGIVQDYYLLLGENNPGFRARFAIKYINLQ